MSGARNTRGITYAAPTGYRPLQLDLWVPAGEKAPPPVVWIHGGAWLFGDRRYLPPTLRPNQLFTELLAAGLAVATIDYRLSQEAKFPASCTTRRQQCATCEPTPICWASTPPGSESGASRPAASSRPWSG